MPTAEQKQLEKLEDALAQAKKALIKAQAREHAIRNNPSEERGRDLPDAIKAREAAQKRVDKAIKLVAAAQGLAQESRQKYHDNIVRKPHARYGHGRRRR